MQTTCRPELDEQSDRNVREKPIPLDQSPTGSSINTRSPKKDSAPIVYRRSRINLRLYELALLLKTTAARQSPSNEKHCRWDRLKGRAYWDPCKEHFAMTIDHNRGVGRSKDSAFVSPGLLFAATARRKVPSGSFWHKANVHQLGGRAREHPEPFSPIEQSRTIAARSKGPHLYAESVPGPGQLAG